MLLYTKLMMMHSATFPERQARVRAILPTPLQPPTRLLPRYLITFGAQPERQRCQAPADNCLLPSSHLATCSLVVEGGGELDVAGEELGDAVLDLACSPHTITSGQHSIRAQNRRPLRSQVTYGMLLMVMLLMVAAPRNR